MLQVIDAGGQAALLAPTEVLAQQHYRSVSDLLGPLGQAGRLGGAEVATRVALLTGSQPAAARRDALREKAQDARPHVLVMTATPIPRTVAMTVLGDLDVSTLSELPRGRSPIATHVVPALEKPRYLERAWERVVEEAEKGRQAYVVCPRIGEDDGAPSSGETDDAPTFDSGDADAALGGDDDDSPGRPPLAVLDVAPALAQGPLGGLRLRVMHGRLPTDDKDAAMRAFADGSADVLVSTTVVEVGVDVPNATVMVIMDADRFGVSQLHQLRGRVGRGTEPGLCLLVTEAAEESKARQRLADVAGTVDGFRLAEIDLEQRREGDVLGAAQAGRKKSLKLLSVLRDRDLIVAARTEATELVDADPELAGYPALAAEMSALLDEEQAGFLEKT